MWWVYNPHDGRRQANSKAQLDLMNMVPGLNGSLKGGVATMSDLERAAAAMEIWNKEKGFAAVVLVAGWFIKVCPCNKCLMRSDSCSRASADLLRATHLLLRDSLTEGLLSISAINNVSTTRFHVQHAASWACAWPHLVRIGQLVTRG
jgi:hypothetical protein